MGRPIQTWHPAKVLALISHLVQKATPERWAVTDEEPEPMDFDYLVDKAVRDPRPSNGVILTVLTELHGDNLLRQRCRHVLTAWPHELPDWTSGLTKPRLEKAVRVLPAFGDDELLLVGIGMGEYDMTAVVRLDNHWLSAVVDVGLDVRTVDEVLAGAQQDNDPRDYTVTEIRLADARARIIQGIERASWLPIRATENWPGLRPALQSITRWLPDGGSADLERLSGPSDYDVLDGFFASAAGRPFDDAECRRLLMEVVCDDDADPRRWSPARVGRALDPDWPDLCEVPRPTLIELPRLLAAYIGFVHPQVGVRDEFTAQTLAVIDRRRLHYQQAVIDRRDEDDDWEVGA